MHKNMWIVGILLFIIFVIVQVYYYQKRMEEKEKLIFEIEKFSNMIQKLQKNQEQKYQLTDDDIFELITNYERLQYT
jgi:biopolymer transport protein ExbB/TolQ